MADDAVVIEARIESLKRALSSGVLMVKHGDTTTEYRSIADILTAIEYQLGLLSRLDSTPRTRVRYPIQLTKGL